MCSSGNLNLSSCRFSPVEVYDLIDGLKSNFSSGPDGIPAIILKRCVSSLSAPLCSLFNVSVGSGHFPEYWKSSFVTPIYKSGPKHDVTNYRGYP